jgi:hypothetical protein
MDLPSSGIATALVFLFAGCSAPKSTSSVRVPDPLDPELYQPHIVLLDIMIYSDGPIGPEAQLMLSESIGRFSEATLEEQEFPETAKQIGKAFDTLFIKVQEATGKHMEDSGIREEWARIRSTYFEDASWFRHSPEDPTAHLRPGPRMDPASGTVQRYVRGREKLEEAIMGLIVIASAAAEAGAATATPTAERARMLAAIELELDKADSLFATPISIDDRHYQLAASEGREASRLIRAFLAGGGDTTEGSPSRRMLEQSVEHISAAEEFMDKIGS